MKREPTHYNCNDTHSNGATAMLAAGHLLEARGDVRQHIVRGVAHCLRVRKQVCMNYR